MKLFAFTLITALVAAAPAPLDARGVASLTTAASIETAVLDWQTDTSIVSDFLNDATTFKNQKTFYNAAVAAYNAEVNELKRKAVLDRHLPDTPQIDDADNVLVTDGTAQSVVTLLNTITTFNFNQVGKIQAAVNQINNGHNGIQGRCQAVLPAIDVYFNQAAEYVQILDEDTSLFGTKAIVPTACGGIYSAAP